MMIQRLLIAVFLTFTLYGCVESSTTTMPVEEKPYVIEAEEGIPITELDYIYRHCKGGLYTKTYEVDGQRYQIFWT